MVTGDGENVQVVENMPVVSQKASDELIRRVQTPGSLGDSSWLRVQLGCISTVNFFPLGFLSHCQDERYHQPESRNKHL